MPARQCRKSSAFDFARLTRLGAPSHSEVLGDDHRHASQRNGSAYHFSQRLHATLQQVSPDGAASAHASGFALLMSGIATADQRPAIAGTTFCLAHAHVRFSIFNGDNVVENHVRSVRDRCLAWPATQCLQKRQPRKNIWNCLDFVSSRAQKCHLLQSRLRPDLLWALPGQASRISHRRVEVTPTRKITGGFRN